MTVSHYVLLGRSAHLGYLARKRTATGGSSARRSKGSPWKDSRHARDRLSGGERQRVAIARALTQASAGPLDR